MVSILHTFLLAMTLNPDTMRKAQEKLDQIIGSERLPDVSGKEYLPYTSAIFERSGPVGIPPPA